MKEKFIYIKIKDDKNLEILSTEKRIISKGYKFNYFEIFPINKLQISNRKYQLIVFIE
jgi:hypothetical protein